MEHFRVDGVGLGSLDQALLIVWVGLRFHAGHKAGSNPHAVGTQRQGCGQSTAVNNASRRDHRYRCHRLNQRRHEGYEPYLTAHMAAKLQPFGMQLESVGVKDIVLPGEMKTILTQVVQAQKQAEANVIRRREETAATRSLLNTAKVMEDNPVALRMKELETLERVAERIDKISVFGGLDQVLNGLVKMR